MWDSILYLLEEIETFDDLKRPHYSFIDKKVCGNKLSVKRTEFYQAQAAGYKPEKSFEIKTIEFDEDKHTHVRYNNKVYKILRSYEKDSELTELTLIGLTNNHE